MGIYIYGNSGNNTVSNNVVVGFNGYGIGVFDSADIDIKWNDASWNTNYGIWFYNVWHSEITENIITHNDIGIKVTDSHYIEISGNLIEHNDIGIKIDPSDHIRTYDNVFNNTLNAWDDGVNEWNTTLQCGGDLNIIGGDCTMGNFWTGGQPYTGEDLDGDGIGDTNLPYNAEWKIKVGGDYGPLVEVEVIPTVSEWGLVVISLLLLTGAKIYFGRRRVKLAA